MESGAWRKYSVAGRFSREERFTTATMKIIGVVPPWGWGSQAKKGNCIQSTCYENSLQREGKKTKKKQMSSNSGLNRFGAGIASRRSKSGRTGKVEGIGELARGAGHEGFFTLVPINPLERRGERGSNPGQQKKKTANLLRTKRKELWGCTSKRTTAFESDVGKL